jgi:hypothetical protein
MMVEAKLGASSGVNEQWHALVALHRTLRQIVKPFTVIENFTGAGLTIYRR